MVRGTDARAHRESKLRRVLHRVTASNEALADDDLQRSSLDAGASTIAEAKLRTRASLQGRIEADGRRVIYNPRYTILPD